MEKARFQAHTVLILSMLFFSIMILVSCNGTGGSKDSDGLIYTGTNGYSSQASGSGTDKVLDILEYFNSGDIQSVVELLGQKENATSESPTMSTVTFNAADIGLPSGGTVKLTMTVDGNTKVYTAKAGTDGKVKFDIPAVPIGSSVSVQMDVLNAAGVPFYTGKAEKTVSDGDPAFTLTLKPMMDRTVEYTGSQSEQVDVWSNGDETIYVTLKDFSIYSDWSCSAFCIRNSHPGTVTTAYVDIQGSVSLTGYNHGGFKLCTDGAPGGTVNVIFLSSSSGTLEFAYQSGASGSLQVEHLEGHSITVMDGCTVSGMESGNSSSMTSYSDWSGFLSAAQTNIVSRFTISKD
ncbi:MAG: hypothetical protein IJU95_02210 [Treponema sp.]|nr:hypothetical protein [Treponema sp.]